MEDLRFVLHEWQIITNNSMVLNTIQGCGIYFVHIPEQVTVPRQIQFDVDEVNLIKNLGFIID